MLVCVCRGSVVVPDGAAVRAERAGRAARHVRAAVPRGRHVRGGAVRGRRRRRGLLVCRARRQAAAGYLGQERQAGLHQDW